MFNAVVSRSASLSSKVIFITCSRGGCSRRRRARVVLDDV
jgi:hypothetical protein